MTTQSMSQDARAVRLRATLKHYCGIILEPKVPRAEDFESKAKQLESVGATQAAAMVRRAATYL
jgi:hypothetical protein